MRYFWLALLIATAAQAEPRNVRPTTPDKIYQNDRDLWDAIRYVFLGAADGSDARTGYWGQIISSTTQRATNVGATAAVFDTVGIFLNAGDWDASGVVHYARGGATFTTPHLLVGVSSTSGNSFTGLAEPTTRLDRINDIPTTFTDAYLPFGPVRLSLTVAATYYLKGLAETYSVAVPTYTATFRARRVR